LLHGPILSLVDQHGLKFLQLLEALVVNVLQLLRIRSDATFPIDDLFYVFYWDVILLVFDLFYLGNDMSFL